MSFDNLIGYILSISMCMQNCITIFFTVHTVQEIGPFSLFPNLELGKASTVKKCQFAIFWARSCQEIGPFSLFQNLELGKASTVKNISLQSFGLDLVNINVYANVYQNIPHSSRDRAIFTFSEFGTRQTLTDDKCHFAIPSVDLFNINLSAKFYQNIPNRLRVKFHFLQNLNLGKTLTDPKCHLTISRAKSCQYQCVCKFSSQYSTLFKR